MNKGDNINKEKLGALMDAIYPIVMTILVLELGEPEIGINIEEYVDHILPKIIDYFLSFLLLFSFWFNQTRINNVFELEHSRLTLWLNSFVLMLVTLLPFSIRLLHTEKYFGQDMVNLHHFDFTLNYEVFVDSFFIANWLLIDLIINLILFVTAKRHVQSSEGRKKLFCLIRNRVTTTSLFTILFITVIILNALLNYFSPRRVLFLFPLLLIFEDEIVSLLNKEGLIINLFLNKVINIFKK